jgi:hypothetical protein
MATSRVPSPARSAPAGGRGSKTRPRWSCPLPWQPPRGCAALRGQAGRRSGRWLPPSRTAGERGTDRAEGRDWSPCKKQNVRPLPRGQTFSPTTATRSPQPRAPPQGSAAPRQAPPAQAPRVANPAPAPAPPPAPAPAHGCPRQLPARPPARGIAEGASGSKAATTPGQRRRRVSKCSAEDHRHETTEGFLYLGAASSSAVIAKRT